MVDEDDVLIIPMTRRETTTGISARQLKLKLGLSHLVPARWPPRVRSVGREPARERNTAAIMLPSRVTLGQLYAGGDLSIDPPDVGGTFIPWLCSLCCKEGCG